MLDKSLGIYIGRSATQSVWDMKEMHSHGSHELYYLISGQRRYLIGHLIYDVSPGDLVVIPRSRLHRTVTPRSSGYDRYVCNFMENRIESFLNDLGRNLFEQLLDWGCVQLPSHASRRIYRDLQQLEHELTHRPQGADVAALHLLQDILLCALRYGSPKDPVHGAGADKIQELTAYVAQNYAQPLTLRDVAAIACLEETYFSKRFKTLTGFGFQEYLTQIRLQAAEQLLRDTSLSMGEIAEQCGFSGANYFGDVFRRWEGIAPSQYRKTQQTPLSDSMLR